MNDFLRNMDATHRLLEDLQVARRDAENKQIKAENHAKVDAARARAVAIRDSVFDMLRARGLNPGNPHGEIDDATFLQELHPQRRE